MSVWSFTYGETVIVCESGEGSGTTGTDSSILDLQISFENCSMNEVLAASSA
jgi:hypothetical protein